MIEIIYNDTGKNGGKVIVKPPKNIRQIGSPRGRHKIYMEDYVCTFLHSTIFENGVQKRAAVLLGKSEVAQDIRYTFISSAILCEDVILRDQGILFDESSWEYIYKEIKEYFDGQDIVGWFLGMSGFPLELSPAVEAAHRKYFTGRDKVLFLLEPSEGEDVFFAYEQGILQKKEGYYIYYEKNLPMQEYMVSAREKQREYKTEASLYPAVLTAAGMQTDGFGREAPLLEKAEPVKLCGSKTQADTIEAEEREFLHSDEASAPLREERTEEEHFFTEQEKEAPKEEKDDFFRQQGEGQEKRSADQAIQDYRHMLSERKAAPPQKRMNFLLYTAASAAMVVLCVIGITAINNYDKMQQVEEVLSVMSGEAGAKTAGSDQQSGPMIESVPGEVTPRQDGEAASDGTSSQSGTSAEAGGTDQNKDAAEAGQGEAAAGTEAGGTDQSKAASGTEAGGTDQNKDAAGTDQGEGAAGQNEGATGTEAGATDQNEGAAGAEAGAADQNEGASGTEANPNAPAEGQSGSEPGAAGQEAATQPQTAAPDSDSEGGAGDGSENASTTQPPEGAGQEGEESQETSAQVYLDQGYYIVQPGDKLELICRKIYNTTAMMDKLCEANQIEDTDKIYAGQKLVLP